MRSQFLLFLASMITRTASASPVVDSNVYEASLDTLETRSLLENDLYDDVYPRSDSSKSFLRVALNRRTPPKTNQGSGLSSHSGEFSPVPGKHDHRSSSSSSSSSVEQQSAKKPRLTTQGSSSSSSTVFPPPENNQDRPQSSSSSSSASTQSSNKGSPKVIDLEQRQGAERDIQQDKSYNWYTGAMYLTKQMNAAQLRILGLRQARHLVGQANWPEKQNRPGDMTAIYVPLENQPNGAVALIAYGTNLRFDKTCRPRDVKENEVQNTGPNFSEAAQAALPLAKPSAQGRAQKQGPHGEIVCIDELVKETKELSTIKFREDGFPIFPEGSMTISYLLTNPDAIIPQPACDNVQHGCRDKLPEMRILDIFDPNAQDTQSQSSSQGKPAASDESTATSKPSERGRPRNQEEPAGRSRSTSSQRSDATRKSRSLRKRNASYSIVQTRSLVNQILGQQQLTSRDDHIVLLHHLLARQFLREASWRYMD